MTELSKPDRPGRKLDPSPGAGGQRPETYSIITDDIVVAGTSLNKAPRPADEAERLAALRGMHILDTPTEERFDRITRTARRLLGVSVALVSMVDEDRLWLKSRPGVSVTEIPRDLSFCTYAILGDEPLVVTDVRHDPRFADTPLVATDPVVAFYAGQPVRGRSGHKLGTLCVLDYQPREFGPDEVEILKDLALWVEDELAGGREHYANLFERAPIALWEEDFTKAESWLEGLRVEGVIDLRRYLNDHPGEIDVAIGLIRVVDVNQAVLAMMEADGRDRFLGGFPPELINDEVRRAFLEQLVAIWENNSTTEVEFTGVTMLGNRIDCLLRWSAPSIGAAADLSRVVVAITDLTQRRVAEDALQRSEQRYRELFDTAADAMIGVDGDQQIVLFNAQAESVFGYRAEEIIGRPLVTLLPDRFRQVHPSNVDGFALDGVSRRAMAARGMLRGLRRDGEEFPVEVTISKRPSDGNLEFTAVVRDVTERERAREALEELVRSKDELIASISHEMRTPLTAVVGFAQVLQDEASGLSPAERSEMIRAIVDEGGDLTNIVEDLLTAAKVQAGTLTVVPAPVDLRGQVSQVLDAWNKTEARHIELTGSAVSAMGDGARVRQILRNLISNALKYGGDTIRIRVTGDDTSSRVAVCDTGPGIPLDQQERVFDRYQRAHHSPGLTASMGLGLTISRHLARLMGGDLTYRHEAGETTFELTLPPTD